MILPTLRNSPTMRRAPQRRLFVFISITSWRTSSSVAGRPVGFYRYVHLRAASLRCQASTVLGFIVTMLSTTPWPNRNSDTKNKRSHKFRRGRLTERCKIWSSLRSIRISWARRAGITSQINWRKKTSKMTMMLSNMAENVTRDYKIWIEKVR